jgi:hypothetical protein
MTKTRVLAFAAVCLLAACTRPQPAQTETTAAVAATAQPSTAERAPAPATAPSQDEQNASYVLPGDFAPDTDVDALRTRFGASQVQIGEVPGAEGEMFRGVILFPEDSTRRAYLYFQDEKALRGLSLVRVFESDTRWRLATGITMGMPLTELVRRNGKPIEYTGLDWDYGGTVTDLHGGKLTPPDNEAVISRWQLGAAEREQGYAENAYPVGDDTFSSDDPKYPEQGQNVVVRELSVSFPGEDDL